MGACILPVVHEVPGMDRMTLFNEASMHWLVNMPSTCPTVPSTRALISELFVPPPCPE